MDKNYKIVIKDFSRTPILSDDVFKAMDKNNDGEVSKVSICIILYCLYISKGIAVLLLHCLASPASEKR